MVKQNVLAQEAVEHGTEQTGIPGLPGRFPVRWKAAHLGDLGTITGGGTPSTQQLAYWGGNVAWLTPSEATRCEGLFILDTERHITEAGLANTVARLLPPGTVMMTSRATIGEVVINRVPMATNQGVY